MNLKKIKLGNLINIYDKKRVPLSSREREQHQGVYPYYGAASIMDYVDDYLFDGTYILMGEDGTVVNESGKPVLQIASGKFWCNNHAHVLQNTNYIDFDYLYYLLMNTNVSSIVTGAVQPKISQKNMNNLDVEIFEDITYQKKVASLLKNIDDKIRENERINQNLEQQAQALFKSWFIDFEPFGGVMPPEWHIGKMDEIIQLYDSQRVPLSSSVRSTMDKLYPYYGATSLMDYVDNYLFDGIYVLLGEDGTVINENGFPILQYVYGKFWVNNHAHILTGKSGFSVEELYLMLRSTNVKSIVTGAVQQKISQTNLKKIEVVIPTTKVLTDFDFIIQSLFALIRNSRDEITKLIELRDTLLPRLMSGELDASALEV